MRRRYIQDPQTGKLVPAEDYVAPRRASVHIQPDIAPFVSPVTGETITSRSQLRRHNRDNQVTDARDYSLAYYERKGRERLAEMEGRTRQARDERRRLLNEEFSKRGL